MGNNKDSLRVHSKDSIDIAMEKNDKLLEMVRKLEKENKKMKSQHRTMETAWFETERKYKEVVKEIPLKEIFKEAKSNSRKKLKKKCGQCKSFKIKSIVFSNFSIIICEVCEYRNRIDETDK